MFTCIRCLAETPNDSDICDECERGDSPEPRETMVAVLADALKKRRSTNGCDDTDLAMAILDTLLQPNQRMKSAGGECVTNPPPGVGPNHLATDIFRTMIGAALLEALGQ